MPPTLRIFLAVPLLLAIVSPALAQDSGAISGSVLDKETRVGLADVVVTCQPGESTVTDSHGRFSFHQLRPGRYRIRCEGTDGYARTTQDLLRQVTMPKQGTQLTVDFLLERSESIRGTLVDGSGNPVPDAEVLGRWPGPDIVTSTNTDGAFVLDGFPPWSEVSIGASTDTLIADDVRYEIPDGGLEGVIVRAYRAASIEGRVLDREGQTLNEVSIEWVRHTKNSNHYFPPIQTDEDGRFTLDHLLPAKYTFSIRPQEGRVDVVLRHTFQEGETKKNVKLVYAPDSGPKISGRVVDTQGNPLAGVAFATMGVDAQARTVTDAKGNFVVHDLPEGGYQLAYFEYRGQVYYDVTRARTGDSGVEIELKLRLRRPQDQSTGPIRGRLFDAATDRPITRFTYRLRKGVYEEINPSRKDQYGNRPTGFFDSGNWKAVNHPAGFFEFPTYATGDHSLAVRAEGYGTFTGVVAAPGNGLAIGLLPELRAEGVVRSPAGKPLIGAKVMLGESNWYPPVEPRREHESRTDADGRFAVGGLSTGKTTFTAWHEDWGSATKTIHLTEPVTRIDFTMPATGTLAGFVLLDGELIRDVMIWVHRVEGDVQQYAGTGAACMNDENRYELKRLMPGRLKIHIQLDPYDRENVPRLSAIKFVDIEPGKTAEVLFALQSPDR